MTPLELEFQRAMISMYEIAHEHGYTASYFKHMLDQYGGVETAKRLLAAPGIQEGLIKLWELRLLDHSVEANVLQEQFRELFTEDERAEARRRLDALGYYGRH